MKAVRVVAVLVAMLTVTALVDVAHAAEPVRLSLVSGPVGGTWYPLGAGMVKLIQKYTPEIVTLETGAGVKNARVVGQKSDVVGFTLPDVAYFAVNGGREFKEAKFPLRVVMSGHLSPQHIVTLKESGINRVEDLRGKRVGLGCPGSSAETLGKAILEVHGLTYNDIQPKWLCTSEIINALRDRTIAAGFIAAGVPVGAVTELAVTHNVSLVPITAAKLAEIERQYPYYTADRIPANTYKGQVAAVDALSVGTYLVAHADLSADVVYRMARAIGEHIDELAEVHPSGKEWALARVAQRVAIPRHAGLERYLREKGLLK